MTSRLSKSLALLALLGTLFAAWLWIGYQGFVDTPLDFGETGMRYELKPGTTLTRLARDLQDRGIVEQPRYLIWLARLEGLDSRIKAGEYHFDNGITPRRLLQQLVNGETLQYAITIVEGWNFRQLMDAVHSNEYLLHTLSDYSDDEIMAKLGHPGEHPEGRFLPDTYHFPRMTTDVDFLRRAYAAMEQLLKTEWPARSPELAVKTPYEALILASIVEKETALPSERRQIAGVFNRRLQKRMRLQTDPTVIYGLGRSFDGNIRRRDLRRDTPYNTYLHKGLPPTPIAMPGRDAVLAALHPADGDELYFVARGDGSHAFSATLKAHNRAVVEYQLGGRVKAFSSLPSGKLDK